jgi:hypothetical protein
MALLLAAGLGGLPDSPTLSAAFDRREAASFSLARSPGIRSNL